MQGGAKLDGAKFAYYLVYIHETQNPAFTQDSM